MIPRSRRACLAFLALGACGEDPADGRAAYVDALSHPGEISRCEAILDPSQQGECVAIGAAALAKAGERTTADAACRAIVDPVWQPECWFLIADAVDATGAEARELCGRTGPFQQPCFGHTMGREAGKIFDQVGVGEEIEAEERLARAFEFYQSPPAAGRKAREFLVRHLGARELEAPFQRDLCGAAREDVCRAAFRARVRLLRPTLDLPCPLGAIPLDSLELPPFDSAEEDFVRAALSEACR